MDVADLDPDPLVEFQRWFRMAGEAGHPQPDAMALATAGAGGEPAVRMVLYKGLRDGDLVFYSSTDSLKGRQLAENPRAALAFYWPELRRQVRVSGRVRRLSRVDSLAYFSSRPHEAQVAALASDQSRVIPSRAYLVRRFEELQGRYPPGRVPPPATWGGFRLRPAWIEFWQNQPNRLHDRLRYRRARGDGWRVERLAP
ncbi:MAG TPA: pyridoxamine 5'-phosphate oxidase [Candidatus Acidoferrales bacterium]|nr:pyridoxamine 5'-phosphate oxidase [Candidatus Acidoferrales bacterium]